MGRFAVCITRRIIDTHQYVPPTPRVQYDQPSPEMDPSFVALLSAIVDPPSRTVSKDTSQTVSKDTSQTVSKDTSQTVSKDTSRTVSKDTSRNVSKDTSQTVSKDLPSTEDLPAPSANKDLPSRSVT